MSKCRMFGNGLCLHLLLGLLTFLAIHAVSGQGGSSTNGQHQDSSIRDQLSTESKLAADLLRNYSLYNPNFMRPVRNSSQPVLVYFGISLIQILEFNEKEQTLVTLLWKTYSWQDEYMTWNPAEYDNLSEMSISHQKIWSPDIVLYNNVGKPSAEEHKALVVINSTGHTTWSPAVLYRSSCSLYMKNFPFDEQRCLLRFGPWSHHVRQVDMEFLEGRKEFELGVYLMNSGWEITEQGAERNVRNYTCCPHGFVDLEFFLRVRRRVTFHMRLILVPTILLSLMSCAIFWIPPSRPDRTTLGLGLFSAFFLLLISVLNNSPATTHSKLGEYYIIIILMVCFGILFTVIVVNIGQTNRKVPQFIDKILLIFGCIACHCPRHRTSSSVPLSVVDANVNPAQSLQECPTTNNADATKATLNDRKKWQEFALILDRVVFIIFATCIIVTFILIFPLPGNLHGGSE